MAAFTASQAKVDNGSKVVQINSGESVSNVRGGDFLVIANAIVEINRAYIGADNKGYFELVKNWPNSNQSNQPCIVIPTTGEFKTVVTALHEANALVNDNYQAMQAWQTQMGTVTFVNKDKTTTTVKTLKQIEADMNEYHPYPWAMRKVEFEARRAINNDKFAASGFVHFGKHYDNGSSELKVAEGLYTRIDTANNLRLGRVSSTSQGLSKTNHPFINVSGVVTKIEYLSREDSIFNQVKLPPAEDGTRTYDSATGVSVTHATSAIAFASETATNKVVTDRVDMWGFEEFLREINDADPFVYKYGLIQSQAPNINGVGTVLNNVRPITYFAWYEGDTASRGKGVNWQTATEAQRIAIASDPENNIYFDDATGKFYQWCVRGRSFAGLGNGDWGNIDSTKGDGYYLSASTGNKALVLPQGRLDNNPPTTNTAAIYLSNNVKNPTSLKSGDIALFKVRDYTHDGINYPEDVSVNGECYFLVCGTISRLNQGAYHPSLNPLGANRFVRVGSELSDGDTWDVTAKPYSTLADCMILDQDGGARSNKDFGRILYQASGRPDGRYYDAIYENGQGGVCRDMRYRASGLTDVDFAEADLSIKDGTYRGTEKPPFSVPFVVGPNSITTYISLGETKPNWWDDKILGTGSVTDLGTSKMYVYNQATGEKLFVWLSGYTTTSNIGWYLRTVKVEFASSTAANDNHGLVGGESLILQTTSDKSLSKFSVSGDYTYADVIGDPANIFMCDDLKNGWIGGWCQDIPDGTSKNFKLTRPAQISQSYPSPYTLDNGDNWTATLRTIDLTTNSILGEAWAVGFVTAINYKVKAKITKDFNNSDVFGASSGLGKVYFTSRASDLEGRGLGYSLTSKILKDAFGENTSQTVPILTCRLSPSSNKLINDYISHTPLFEYGRSPLNNSTAFKTLNYNVVENQQAFINYAYTELIYDVVAGDWGDDGKVHIADNQTTMPDENGNTVLVGTARCVEPLGWIKNDK